MSTTPQFVVNPEDGELLEVLPADYVQNGQPYSYPEAKAAAMRVTVERRRRIKDYEDACNAVGNATAHYRRELAKEMLVQKSRHGATMAEQLAKGQEHVAQAKEDLIIAEGKRNAAWQLILTNDADRMTVTQLTKWSQSVEGWEHE